MVKNIKNFILVVAISFGSTFAGWQEKTDKGYPVYLERVDPVKGSFKEDRKVFIDSFNETYGKLSKKELNKKKLDKPSKNDPGILKFLGEAFDETLNKAKIDKDKKWCIVHALNEQKEVIGIVFFEVTDLKKGEVYIAQLAVHPNCWKQGVGKALSFSILKVIKNIKKLMMVTRKVNTGAFSFYKKLGFQETKFEHEGLDPKVYQGMELVL